MRKKRIRKKSKKKFGFGSLSSLPEIAVSGVLYGIIERVLVNVLENSSFRNMSRLVLPLLIYVINSKFINNYYLSIIAIFQLSNNFTSTVINTFNPTMLQGEEQSYDLGEYEPTNLEFLEEQLGQIENELKNLENLEEVYDYV